MLIRWGNTGGMGTLLDSCVPPFDFSASCLTRATPQQQAQYFKSYTTKQYRAMSAIYEEPDGSNEPVKVLITLHEGVSAQASNVSSCSH